MESAGKLVATEPIRLADYVVGFRPRFFAALIDDLLTLGVALVAVAVFGVTPTAQIVVWVCAFAYHAVLDGRGGTLGKCLLGIEVVNEAGEAPGLAAGVVRNLIPVGLGGLSNLIGPAGRMLFWVVVVDGLSMLRHSARQTLHDRMAGTYVVEG
jgi:uncharacterized RDD family membrane protein YckC